MKSVKTPKGDREVAEFSVFADNWKRDADGNFEPDGGFWVRVSVWGVSAKRSFDHLKKGARVTCVGRLTPHEYENKEGESKFEIRLNADEVMLELSRIETVAFRERQDRGDDGSYQAEPERKAA